VGLLPTLYDMVKSARSRHDDSARLRLLEKAGGDAMAPGAIDAVGAPVA